MIDPDQFWERNDDARPGVTESQIQAWEQRRGVSLPALLRQILTRQNGGAVRLGEIDLDPLDEIKPVDEDFRDHTEIDDDAPDHALVFTLGGNDAGGRLLMNFNTNGPEGEPSLYLFYNDGCGSSLIGDSLDEFFEAELACDDEPAVDWSEWKQGMEVVARETIDLTYFEGDKAEMEQVLARQDNTLIMFKRTWSSKGEIRAKTTLPLPLDPQRTKIRPLRPGPNPMFALDIQPEEPERVLEVNSSRAVDGRWKNTTRDGTLMMYAWFEFNDRARLETLRTDLFGQTGAERAQAGPDLEASLQTHPDSPPDNERLAASTQMCLCLNAKLDPEFATQVGDLGPPPPELADPLRQKIDALARDQTAQAPPGSETLDHIRNVLNSKTDDSTS